MGITAGLLAGVVATSSLMTGADGKTPAGPLFERASVGEGWIAYEDTGGTGPVVLCLPGMGDTRQEYRFLAPLLQKAGYRVLTADLRGHGDSSLGFATYRPEDLGDDALAVLDHARVAKATLVGCSVSAGSIAWAAAKAPDRIEAIVMLGPAVRDGDEGAVQKTMNQWLYAALFSRPWGPSVWGWFFGTLFKKHHPQDFQAYQSALVRMLNQPGRQEALKAMILASKKTVSDRLGQVKAPTLLVMGNADPDFPNPRAEAETIRSRLGGSTQVEVLDGLGHYPHVEEPEAVSGLVLRFLQERTHGS